MRTLLNCAGPRPGQHKEGSANNQLSTREHVCLDVPSVPEPSPARSATNRTTPSSRRTVESEGRGPAYDRRRAISVAPRAASVKHPRNTSCARSRCSTVPRSVRRDVGRRSGWRNGPTRSTLTRTCGQRPVWHCAMRGSCRNDRCRTVTDSSEADGYRYADNG